MTSSNVPKNHNPPPRIASIPFTQSFHHPHGDGRESGDGDSGVSCLSPVTCRRRSVHECKLPTAPFTYINTSSPPLLATPLPLLYTTPIPPLPSTPLSHLTFNNSTLRFRAHLPAAFVEPPVARHLRTHPTSLLIPPPWLLIPRTPHLRLLVFLALLPRLTLFPLLSCLLRMRFLLLGSSSLSAALTP